MSEKKTVPRKNGSEKKIAQKRMDCNNNCECKKYMGNGGLSQVAVSETVDTGVL